MDSNSRLSMASAVSAYQLAFGSDGPPSVYDDFEVADCFLFIGSNAAEPAMFVVLVALAMAYINYRVLDPQGAGPRGGADSTGTEEHTPS